ncbi:hypothetical protein JXA80_04530 [bacterium]|nr:hypothetical protein [candidate division CSSED10-310 bacterium]
MTRRTFLKGLGCVLAVVMIPRETIAHITGQPFQSTIGTNPEGGPARCFLTGRDHGCAGSRLHDDSAVTQEQGITELHLRMT